MTDKNWKDSLRQRMLEHKETPPDGLWEALEASGAVAPAGSPAGAALGAGSGLLGRIFGRRWAPAWLAFAGVAAGLAAFLLLRTPSGQPQSNPASIIAEVTVPQIDADAPVDAAPQVDADAPVDTAPQPGVDSTEPVRAQNGKISSPVVSEQPVRAQKGDISAPAASDQPVRAQNEANRAGEAGEPAADSPAADAPVAGEPQVPAGEGSPVVPKASRPAHGGHVVPLTHSARRNRPLFAAALTGGGMPGGANSTSVVEYGMPNYRLTGVRQASVLSRNRITETNIIRKMDFQVGLMVSFDLSRHWGLETGLQYTRLGSSLLSTSGSISSTTEEKFNYIGIPLHVVYTPLDLGFLSVYLSAGPEIEYGFQSSWRVMDIIDAIPSVTAGGTDNPGDFVFSGSVNTGVQLRPFRHGAFFLQPGVVFRYTTQNSPESYYTQNPVSFRLSAGYRITF